jgi:hypothetical protein
MTLEEGLKNFVVNIKPTMLKCQSGARLTKDEQYTIAQFYLEVIHYLSQQGKP